MFLVVYFYCVCFLFFFFRNEMKCIRQKKAWAFKSLPSTQNAITSNVHAQGNAYLHKLFIFILSQEKSLFPVPHGQSLSSNVF